ncbi:acyl-CoA desaturase [Schlesneria paludicola]|uniref:acyl-CoA desaturase n=1 Tax=Schlesneria paludicola TaxID=360056 RepID=UPI000299F637|nr:acyl-CoA desaturase [Schlesneria paludicola]
MDDQIITPHRPDFQRGTLIKGDGTEAFIPRAAVASSLRLFLILCHGVPFIGGLIAVAIIPIWPPSVLVLVSMAVMWSLSLGFGITIGYHRLFSHRAFQTSTPMRVFLAICGSMAGQGPLIAWVALHRCHHQHTDTDGDPHSPWPNGSKWFQKLVGLWHAHYGWLFSSGFPNSLQYCPDLIRDRAIARTSRMFLVWYIMGLCLPSIVIWMVTGSTKEMILTFLWAGCLRVAAASQVTWSINSLCHFLGAVPHATGDHSTNLSWLAVPSFGESWHNNHHAYPQSAKFSCRSWQLDLGYALICVMRYCGMVWDVQTPKTQKGENR